MRGAGLRVALATLGVCGIAGCARGPETLTIEFWTTDHEQDRVETQRRLAAEFASVRPGVRVNVIGVSENDLPKRLAAYRAAGKLPDVLRLGLEYAGGYADEGILDPAAATEVIEELGTNTFFAGPLRLLRLETGEYAAVPIDGWLQCLWYRKDWFEEEGLDPPDTWDKMLAAARMLHSPRRRSYGIVTGTDPQQVYTQQTFEHIALSGGVRLFGPTGGSAVDPEKLARALEFYGVLAAHGPPGNCYWREARKYYLSGRAAMIFYSPYIIDDIAGLVEEHRPIAGLAANTDFVSVLRGPDGREASYGQVVSLGIARTGNEERRSLAKQWVSYLLSDGYLAICNMSPGGKVPVRKTVLEEWRKHPYFRYYPEGLADRLAAGMDKLRRWGWHEGRRYPEITKVYAQKIVPALVGEVLEGRLSTADAADRLGEELAALSPREP